MDMLQARDVRVLYGKAIALRGLSMSVKPGEFVGVIGPNGAGKSTLLKAISGMVPISGGEILFDGKRTDSRQPHEIVGMGIIQCPERRQIFIDFNISDNLEMGAFLRKDKDGIRSDLDYVYSLFPVLRERRKQLGGTLSGGEQQMLAIGRSIMSRPRLLMLDEPSIGLAPVMKKTLIEAISKIWESGITVLIVEQDASLTLDVAQRVYVLEHGKVGLEGTSEELSNNEEVRRCYFQLG
jgi:branched-chain amino acid transport system ATP-binding protein